MSLVCQIRKIDFNYFILPRALLRSRKYPIMSSLCQVELEEMEEEKTGMRYLPIPEKTRRKSFLKNFGGRKLGTSRISKAAGTVRRASVQVKSLFFYLCYASFRFEVSSMTYNASLLAIQDPVDCRKSAKQTSSCLLYTASGFDIAVILLTSGSSISPKTFKSLLC